MSIPKTVYGSPQVIPARDGFDLVATITGNDGPDEVFLEPIICWVVTPVCVEDHNDEAFDPLIMPVVASGMLPSEWAIRTPDGKIHFVEDQTVEDTTKALEVFKEKYVYEKDRQQKIKLRKQADS